jgi:hypothetical protein
MTNQRQIHLRHLPNKKEHIFYILVLIISSFLNATVASIIYKDVRHLESTYRPLFPLIHDILALSGYLFDAVLVLTGINIIQSLINHSRKNRKTLLIMAIFSALYLALNLLTISYGIYEFKIQSYWLLIISACVYLSVNTTFVFWYWYLDYPTQIRSFHHPECRREINFPEMGEGGKRELPSFLDYLYFTVITSNTLGTPENHSPNSQKAKALLMLHSLTMMILLVIFASRAINTLS